MFLQREKSEEKNEHSNFTSVYNCTLLKVGTI
jgi:hypothetical protein